ncbi:MAG: MFS transporter [Chitinophagaceae bacterium]|nr:MFS transporter [Chitinophagaceae bacterium]
MIASKPRLSFAQIINMNVGFFGIQYSFGLQQSAVNPIYDFLGAKPDEIPWLNLAGPLTGLIIQPIIGALSDKTWHPKFGRRRPYFFIGAIMCSLALFFFPFSSSLWMAAGLLWILDAGNNTAMEPYRAFVADKLDSSQQGTGFQAQSFFTGFGQTLANLSLFIFPMIIVGKTGAIPNWVFGSFFLGAVCSVTSIWWSMRTTPEIPPSDEEIKAIKEYNADKPPVLVQFLGYIIALSAVPLLIRLGLNSFINTDILNILTLPVFFCWIFFLEFLLNRYKHISAVNSIRLLISPLIEIIDAIKTMPRVMWLLALVYLFQWYALFCYWQNSSKAIAKNSFEWKLLNDDESKVKAKFTLFEDALKKFAIENKLELADIKKTDSTYTMLYNNWSGKLNMQQHLSGSDLQTLEAVHINDKKYEQAVSWTGLVNFWYNVVTFLVAFGLVVLAKKIGPRQVHTFCLLMAGAGFIAFAFVQNKYLFFPAITGFGIGWASMMGIPYLIVMSDIPKERYGVYMGIINMMIVIPMFIQTITFGYVMKHFLHNDSSKAVGFAGILLLIAAVATLLIKNKKINSNELAMPAGGGH